MKSYLIIIFMILIYSSTIANDCSKPVVIQSGIIFNANTETSYFEFTPEISGLYKITDFEKTNWVIVYSNQCDVSSVLIEIKNGECPIQLEAGVTYFIEWKDSWENFVWLIDIDKSSVGSSCANPYFLSFNKSSYYDSFNIKFDKPSSTKYYAFIAPFDCNINFKNAIFLNTTEINSNIDLNVSYKLSDGMCKRIHTFTHSALGNLNIPNIRELDFPLLQGDTLIFNVELIQGFNNNTGQDLSYEIYCYLLLNISPLEGSLINPLKVSSFFEGKTISLPSNAQKNLYYYFVASQTGRYSFQSTMLYDSVDTKLSVYKGFQTDTLLAYNNDIFNTKFSYVNVFLEKGDTLLIHWYNADYPINYIWTYFRDDDADLISNINDTVIDTDSDTDGLADYLDSCPFDSRKFVPGLCGCGFVEGKCIDNIKLLSGFNMIFLEYTPDSNKVDSVFKNAEMVKTIEQFYLNSQSEMFNTLKQIHGNQVYFINNSKDEIIYPRGTQIVVKQCTIRKGWNAVGIPQNAEMNTSTLPTAIEIVKNFDGFFEKGNSLSTITELKSGAVYFMYSTDNVVIYW